MARSTRLRVRYEVSDNTDYSRPAYDESFSFEFSASSVIPIYELISDGAATDLMDASQLSAVEYAVLFNASTTAGQGITITWTDLAGTPNANTHFLEESSAPLVIGPLAPGTAITAIAEGGVPLLQGIIVGTGLTT